MKMSRKKFYDTLRKTVWTSDISKEKIGYKNYFFKKLYDEIFYRLLLSQKGSVLDLGCGESNKYKMLEERLNFIVGMDVSILALKQSIENGATNLILADAGYLPFRNNSFDLIICDQLLEHVPKPEKTVEEIKKVGRIFIIGVPNEKLVSQRVVNKLIKYNPISIGHINKFDYKTWRRLIETHLQIDKCIGISFLNLLNFPSLAIFHKFFYEFEKIFNLPSLSFILIFTGKCR